MPIRPFTGLVLSVLVVACNTGHRARSERAFHEIAALVAEASASEVVAVLGEPDSRQSVFLHDERWIWWNYTYLDGPDHPPELRGRVVHLEITLRRNQTLTGVETQRVARPFGVAYRIPGEETAAPAHTTVWNGGAS